MLRRAIPTSYVGNTMSNVKRLADVPVGTITGIYIVYEGRFPHKQCIYHVLDGSSEFEADVEAIAAFAIANGVSKFEYEGHSVYVRTTFIFD